MGICLQCGKSVKQPLGKREKKFCNDTCRSNYRYAQNKKAAPEVKKELIETKKDLSEKKHDLSEKKVQIVFDSKIPPMPVMEKGEHPIDFAARKNEWKRLYGK